MTEPIYNCEGTRRRDFLKLGVGSFMGLGMVDLLRQRAQAAQVARTAEQIVTELYLAGLSRFPSEDEMRVATAAFSAEGATRKTAAEDILWALMNSAEFVFNH